MGDNKRRFFLARRLHLATFYWLAVAVKRAAFTVRILSGLVVLARVKGLPLTIVMRFSACV